MTGGLLRREFITLAVALAAACPGRARAQQAKRLGVLMNGSETEPGGQANLALLVEGLRRLGWISGQNALIETRFSAGDPTRMEAYAHDLVGLLRPDVLMAASTPNLAALQRATTTVPIVFTQVTDPVEQGFVSNLARPGGHITGFANPEFSIAGKWADLLKQMAPKVTRVAVLYNPDSAPQSKFYLNAIRSAAPALAVEVAEIAVRSTAEFETALVRLEPASNVGLICPPDTFTRLRAKMIVDTLARYRLPAIYAEFEHIAEGGLMQYFNDTTEQYRQAPFYIDRLLKGTKPGDLPVQLPTKFKFVVNRRTATALGIDVPLGILLAADEVIE
jgi:putative ABC transport system substrate-binding protein